jgi:ubiquinone/menaquinone biosynthesis C-methylase UbiE
MMKMISPKQDERILDAGCGSGDLSYEMGKGTVITALDLSFSNIRNAKTKLDYLGYKGFFIVGSVTHLPFRSQVFDKTLLSSVLQHIPNPLMALEEIHRVLRTAGTFVINVPSDKPYLFLPLLLREKYSRVEKALFCNNFKAHYKWSAYQMKRMLEKTGFKVVQLEYSPKYIGAFVYEVNLLPLAFRATKRAGRRLLVFSPLFYAISRLDYALPKRMLGSEFIMKTRKIPVR